MGDSNWRNRKARRQIRELDLPSSVPPQTGTTFNIWYNKWSHGTGPGNGVNNSHRYVSPFRLDPVRDSGVTNSDSDCNTYCLYFARGCCVIGSKCKYLHHIPEINSDDRIGRSRVKDCFGRLKYSHYRDDMSGVGSFQNDNSTLYIGGISNALNDMHLKPIQIENRLKYLFEPLGAINKIRYLEDKNCAFVEYKWSINAEFAKEAMSNQTLLIPNDKEWDRRMDGSGLLVKWAHEDPDPIAKRQRALQRQEESINLMKSILKEYNPQNSNISTTKGKEEIEDNSNSDTHSIQLTKKRKLSKENTHNGNEDDANNNNSTTASPLPLISGYSSSSSSSSNNDE